MGKKGKWMKNIVLVSVLMWLFFMPVLTTDLSNASADNDQLVGSEESMVDSNWEIITSVNGDCNKITIRGLGFVRRAEIWTGDMKTRVILDGHKYPILNNPGSHFTIDYATHIKIPHFIGFRYKISTIPTYVVRGIALGNIEWE
jgi:hypothetical protein